MKQNVLRYFIVTCGLSWLIWLPAVLDSIGIMKLNFNNDLIRFIGSTMPTFTALVFVWRYERTEGLKQLLLRGVKFRFSAGWYIYIFLLVPMIAGSAFLIVKLFSGFTYTAPFPVWFLLPAFFIILFAMGPVEEEFGWRGYALDKLLMIYKPVQAGLIVGLVWSVWHLPLFLIKGTVQYSIASNGLFLVFIGYSVQTVLLSILITVLYIETGESVLAAILFHTVSNLTHGFVPLYSSLYGGACFISVMLVVTLMVIYKRRENIGVISCIEQKKNM